MKKSMLVLLIASCPLSSMAGTDSCNDQLADLNAKMEMAQNSNNGAEVSRLNIAINKVKTYCTDERQVRRANQDVSKREMKVRKAELELQDAQQELSKAQEDGRSNKIAKKSHKVEEKKLKLESAKSDLKEAQDDATRLN